MTEDSDDQARRPSSDQTDKPPITQIANLSAADGGATVVDPHTLEPIDDTISQRGFWREFWRKFGRVEAIKLGRVVMALLFHFAVLSLVFICSMFLHPWAETTIFWEHVRATWLLNVVDALLLVLIGVRALIDVNEAWKGE